MKHWQETRQILDRLAALRAEGTRAALATVVRVRGSAYRRPGAKLLVDERGQTVGNVSGGCLDQDVRAVALGVIERGRSERRSYCSGADPVEAWDLGVGCEGEVEVHVAPVGPWPDGLRERFEGEVPFAFCYLAEEGLGDAGGLLLTAEGARGTLGSPMLDAAVESAVGAGSGEASSGLLEVEGRSVFVDRFTPPPRLLVFGAGDDARPLVRLAMEVGFRVTVVDRRPGLLAAERFPPGTQLVAASGERLATTVSVSGDCFALLMTHSYADDRAYAAALASAPLRYLGFLGPRARTERILTSLGLESLIEDPHVFGPVGLDVGTEGAEQVAVSIVAELLAARSGRAGGSLRERCAPIHAAFR
ncbi:MAG TPA: XdhC family protein [Longimicrobiaceae bacterium]